MIILKRKKLNNNKIKHELLKLKFQSVREQNKV